MSRTEERVLELEVGLVERGVVPIEAAANLGSLDQEWKEDAREQGLVLGAPRRCVGTREDRSGGFTAEILQRDARVLALHELVRARLDEWPHERTVFVERGAAERCMLLE